MNVVALPTPALFQARTKAFNAAPPSLMLDMAINDLEQAEDDPHFAVDMSYVHATQRGKCRVNLSGAVLAKRLGFPRSAPFFRDTEFDPVAKVRLSAINQFRVGDIENALWLLGVVRPDSMPSHLQVTSYKECQMGFKASMYGVIALLKRHEL